MLKRQSHADCCQTCHLMRGTIAELLMQQTQIDRFTLRVITNSPLLACHTVVHYTSSAPHASAGTSRQSRLLWWLLLSSFPYSARDHLLPWRRTWTAYDKCIRRREARETEDLQRQQEKSRVTIGNRKLATDNNSRRHQVICLLPRPTKAIPHILLLIAICDIKSGKDRFTESAITPLNSK